MEENIKSIVQMARGAIEERIDGAILKKWTQNQLIYYN